MDVITAHEQVDLVLNEMRTTRASADEEFRRMFQASSMMADKAGHAIEIPRRCKRQTLRSNVEADTPEAYYTRSVFVPFVDNMVEQLVSRFSQLTVHACRAQMLIPANLENLTDDHVKELHQYHEPDLPSPMSFDQELRLWKSQWQDEPDRPDSLQSTYRHKYSNPKVYPSVCNTAPPDVNSNNKCWGGEGKFSTQIYQKCVQEHYEGIPSQCSHPAFRPQGH